MSTVGRVLPGVTTMRILRNGAVLLLLAAVLPACPFESKVPLARPTARAVDARLTGFWVWDDPDDAKNAALLLVKPFNESEYLVELQGGKDAEPSHFRAFAFEVGDQLFWSANEVSTTFPPTTWCFTRCAVTDSGELLFRFVGEKKVPKSLESDAEGLTALLRAHLNDTLLDDTEKGLYRWRRPREGEVVKGRLARFAPAASGAEAADR